MCTTSKWNLIIFASETWSFSQVGAITEQEQNIFFFYFFLLLSPTQTVSQISEQYAVINFNFTLLILSAFDSRQKY
jgi:hypothetical protein